MLIQADIRARVWAIAACALFLALASLPARVEAAEGQADAPAVKRLCGATSDARPRVLIGRFSLFGDFDLNLSRNLNGLFADNVAFGLQHRPEVAAFAVRNDLFDMERFKSLPDLIDNAFNLGLPAAAPGLLSDPAINTHAQALVTALRENGCEYLMGGRISRDGSLITVDPYLLTMQSGETSRPFAPISGEAQSLAAIAERFVVQLVSYLRERRPELERRVVEVTCLAWSGDRPQAMPQALLSIADDIGVLVRNQIIASLGVQELFSIRPSGASPCRPANDKLADDVIARVTGQLASGEKGMLEVRPSVKLALDGGDVDLALIRIPAAASSLSLVVRLPPLFAAEVREFLVGVIQPDGGSLDRAALAVYQDRSRSPDSAATNLALGRIFYGKQKTEFALRYFLRAKAAEPSFGPAERAELNERLGELTKDSNERVTFYRNARAILRTSGNNPDAQRLTREIARALYLSGQLNEAISELQGQADLGKDSKSLRELGKYLSLSERDAEAVEQLSAALRLDRMDDEAKELLANTYESLGRKAYASGELIVARDSFGLAASYRPNGQSFYLAGVSAYGLGNYRDAANQFENILKLSSDKVPLKTAESAWLSLLECYLLLGDFKTLETRGQEASGTLRWLPDSRLLAAYLRVVGRIAADSEKPLDTFRRDPAYVEFESGTAPSEATVKNLRWDNSKIDAYLKQRVQDPEKVNFLEDVKRQAWREPKR
jgi:tetratricopeptide (TPR) repeat protein